MGTEKLYPTQRSLYLIKIVNQPHRAKSNETPQGRDSRQRVSNEQLLLLERAHDPKSPERCKGNHQKIQNERRPTAKKRQNRFSDLSYQKIQLRGRGYLFY
jgi:hypothetical protein